MMIVVLSAAIDIGHVKGRKWKEVEGREKAAEELRYYCFSFLLWILLFWRSLTKNKRAFHRGWRTPELRCGYCENKWVSCWTERNKVFLLLLLLLQKSKENNHPICLCRCLACSFHQRKNKSQSSSSFCAISNFKLLCNLELQASGFCTMSSFKLLYHPKIQASVQSQASFFRLLYNLKIQASSPEDWSKTMNAGLGNEGRG